jgi:hypothetical protein
MLNAMLVNNPVPLHTQGVRFASPRAIIAPKAEKTDTFTPASPAVVKTEEKVPPPKWQGLLVQGVLLGAVAIGSFLLGKQWDTLLGKELPKTAEKVLPKVPEPPKPPHPNLAKIEELKEKVRPCLFKMEKIFQEELGQAYREDAKQHAQARINYIRNTNIEEMKPERFDNYYGSNVSELRILLAEIQRLIKEMKA